MATRSMRSPLAAREKSGLAKRSVVAPSACRPASMRSRNSAPRFLEMSSRATRLPASEAGRFSAVYGPSLGMGAAVITREISS